MIEAMASMAILTIGILGTAQIQAAASAQSGSSRRVMVASSMARDFIETAQRWNYGDSRLAGRGCGVDVAVDFPVTDTVLGSEKEPLVPLDFTASGSASDQGDTTAALTMNSAVFDGMAANVLAANPDVYQLMWSVRDINPTNPAATTGCSAKFVQVVVRYAVSKDRYSNVLSTTLVYDSALITTGGLPERI